MADIETLEASWAGVRQIETSDDAIGGPGGLANAQALAIIKRLNLLRNENQALADDPSRSVRVADYAALREFAGTANAVTVIGTLFTAQPSGIAGQFVVDAGDTASTDDGGTIIVGADGRRWKRIRDEASVANVMWFGAKGLGPTSAAEDRDAFARAFASGAKKVIIPCAPVYYQVKEIDVPAGVEVEGIGKKRVYVAYTLAHVTGAGTIVFDTTGSYFINWGGNNVVSNLNLFGSNRTVDAMGPASGAYFKWRNVSCYMFRIGLGRSGAYVGVSWFWDCQAGYNTTGVRNFIDSHFIDCEFNANYGNNVEMQTGANDTVFSGCKNEWAAGLNWQFYQSTSCTISGGVTDRAGGSYGFDIRQSKITIGTHTVRRNGAASLTDSAHFYLENNTVVAMNGVISTAGAGDTGDGNNTPANIFRAGGSGSGKLVASACDFRGRNGALTAGAVLDAVFRGCLGAVETADYAANVSGTAAVSGGTVVASASGDSIATSSSDARKYRASVTFRNPGTGSGATNDFLIAVTRPSGGSAAAAIYSVEVTASTTINTTGATCNVTLENVAADGSTFDVVVTNTDATNARQITVKITRVS